MATEATISREQAVAAARLSIETIMGFDGLPQPDVEQQVRLLIQAHENIMRLQDLPEHRDDAELDELARQLREEHLEIQRAAGTYIAFPVDCVGTYFGVADVQCNGYSTYICRTRAAFEQLVSNAGGWGYALHDIGSSGSSLQLYGGRRGNHQVMVYGPVADQPAA